MATTEQGLTVYVFEDDKLVIEVAGRGLTGATGATGPAGADGAQGPVGPQGAPGVGVPIGGTANQVLSKVDATDYNTQWVDPTTGAVSWGGITGTLSSQTDLQSVLDGKSSTSHVHTGTYEPANANIQGHIGSTSNPHTVTAAQVGAYTTGAVDTLLAGKSDTTHTHTGVYEPADPTILKDADIGVSVAAQGHNHAGVYEPADATILKDADIGVTVAAQSHTHALDGLSDVTITTPASGNVLSYDGAGWVNSAPTGGQSDLTTSVITTNTNAVNHTNYILTASLTLTLPATPSVGQWIGFANRSGTLTATIARNGSNIMGAAEDMTLDSLNARGTLTYVDVSQGWVLINE